MFKAIEITQPLNFKRPNWILCQIVLAERAARRLPSAGRLRSMRKSEMRIQLTNDKRASKCLKRPLQKPTSSTQDPALTPPKSFSCPELTLEIRMRPGGLPRIQSRVIRLAESKRKAPATMSSRGSEDMEDNALQPTPLACTNSTKLAN